MREFKSFKFELKELDEETGIFAGYAATFSNVPDSYGDVIDPGAFKKTLKEGGKRVKVLWNHSVMEPIGKPEEMLEDDHGLLVKGKLSLGVQRAREVLSLMKDGVINEMSIGYDTITEKFEGEGRDRIRHLKEVRLWDVSPVTFAANPEAQVLAVKSPYDDKLTKLEELIKSGRVLSATNRGKVEAAINALSALLEAADGEQEPEKSTPEPEEVKEAAELEQILGSITAELEGFDVREADKRIDKILAEIK